MQRSHRRLTLQLAPGILAFLVAALSVADMFRPVPYDGVILEADVPGVRVVRAVVPGSGADRAGIRPADVIVGIDRTFLDAQTSPIHAQELLNQHDIGDSVAYLVRSGGTIFEVEVELGRRQIGGTTYLYAALLGFLFFGVGTFVVFRQPRLPAARLRCSTARWPARCSTAWSSPCRTRTPSAAPPARQTTNRDRPRPRWRSRRGHSEDWLPPAAGFAAGRSCPWSSG